MVYTWYGVHFKVHISIADVAKDTSFHCFENVRVSTTRIRNKRWRYPFKKIIRFEIIAGSNRERRSTSLSVLYDFCLKHFIVFFEIFRAAPEHTACRVDFWNNFERNAIHREDFSRGEIRGDEVIDVSPNFSSRDTLIIGARHSSVERDADNKASRTITLRVWSVREKRENAREKRERKREAARLRRRCHLLLLLPLCLLCGAVLWP